MDGLLPEGYAHDSKENGVLHEYMCIFSAQLSIHYQGKSAQHAIWICLPLMQWCGHHP